MPGCPRRPGPDSKRGGCVSPFVYRQSALRRERGRFAGTPVERRRTCPDRSSGRPGNRASARIRVRGLRRAAVAEEAIRRFNQQPFKGRPLAVSEARPREDRPPGPRPGGFSGSVRGPAARRPRPAASAVRARAVSPRVRTPGRRRRRSRAAGTSAPMPRQRTNASRRARTRADRRGRSRSVRSAVSTKTTRTGARDEEELDIDNIATSKALDDVDAGRRRGRRDQGRQHRGRRRPVRRPPAGVTDRCRRTSRCSRSCSSS